MVRVLSKIALITSVALLGCSAGSVGDDADPDGSSWPDDPPPGEGGGGASDGGAGGKADDLVVPPADCPEDVICVDSLPFTDTNTTAGASAELDGYGCDPNVNEGGPERVYRLDLAKEGLLVASLDALGAGVDVDIHILQELDAGACVDRGHWDAAALLSPGRFWIVVDSWVDGSGISQEGSYELTIALTTADAHLSEGLDPTVLDSGLVAFARAWAYGDTEELEYGIMDYSMPSTQPRFFVLDLREGQLVYVELGAHGSGSQDPNDMALTGSMSNVSGSHASSVGLVRAAETYWGSNGYSLRLDGLEPGYNDNDRSRAIVVHGADYATQSFVDDNGYLGRSWGCPAVDPAVHEQLIDALAEGRLLLKYFDDSSWLDNSTYVSP